MKNILSSNYKKVFSIGVAAAFILCGFFIFNTDTAFAARTINNATLNGASSVTVDGGASITAAVTVLVTNPSDWRSTRYQIGSGSWTCVNTPDHSYTTTTMESFSITAPSSEGTYNVKFEAHRLNNCTTDLGSPGTITLTNGIVVNAGSSVETNGWKSPSANSTIGGDGIGNPSRAYSSNDQRAEYDSNSDINSYYGFGTTVVPSDVAIEGIQASVEGRRDSGSDRTFDVSLSYNGGANWTTSKNTGDLGTSDHTVTLGTNNNDKWGYGSWTPTIINSDNFQVKIDATSGGDSIWLDHVQIKVYYTDTDSTPPSGGSISYTDGYYTSLSVPITYTLGTDSESGLNNASGKIQRASANLAANGTCGGFGSFSDIVSEFDGSYTDTTVASGKCYMYQYVISDNSGNTATYTSSNVAKIDSITPVLTENIGVPTPTNNTTPSYTFTSSESGTISYGGTEGCGSETTSAVVGSNVITFNTLAEGTYHCTIVVADAAGNSSASLLVNGETGFVIDTTVPTAPTVNAVVSPTNTTPQTISGTKEAGTSIWADNGGLELSSLSFGRIFAVIFGGRWVEVVGADSNTTWSYDFNLNSEGSNSVSFKSKDEAGNESGSVQVTIVYDTTAPTIASHDMVIAEATSASGATVSFEDPSASDEVGPVTVVCDPAPGSTFALGTTVVTCTATDAAGNSSQTTFDVLVRDTTRPLIKLIGGDLITKMVGSTYEDEGATWTDAVDGSGIIYGTGTVDMNTPGYYTLFYNKTDNAGNVAIEDGRTIRVVDEGGYGGGGGTITPTVAGASIEEPTPTPTPTPEPQVLGETTYADGALLRENGGTDIYIVKYVGEKKFKRLIINQAIFNVYGHLKLDDVIDVEKAVLDSFTTSDLVRATGDEKVYKLYPNGTTGEKRWIITEEVFIRFGYDWDSIYEINEAEKNLYIDGPNIE